MNVKEKILEMLDQLSDKDLVDAGEFLDLVEKGNKMAVSATGLVDRLNPLREPGETPEQVLDRLISMAMKKTSGDEATCRMFMAVVGECLAPYREPEDERVGQTLSRILREYDALKAASAH